MTATSARCQIRRRVTGDTEFIREPGNAAFGEFAFGAGDGAVRMASQSETLVAVGTERP